jgi:hypothetical protein
MDSRAGRIDCRLPSVATKRTGFSDPRVVRHNAPIATPPPSFAERIRHEIDIGIDATHRERLARRLSKVLGDSANDQPTCNLFAPRMTIDEKTTWMLRSRLER